MKEDKEFTYHYPENHRLFDNVFFMPNKDPHHFNSKSFYPPVGVWIIIDTPEGYRKVKRPDSYVTQTEDMVYLTKEGNEIKGRYPWRYD